MDLKPKGIELYSKSERPLTALLQEAGVFLNMPCGGDRRCGKCKIKVTGCLVPMSPEERRLLSPEEIAGDIRLACYVKVMGRATVYPNNDDITTLSAVKLPLHTLDLKGYALAVDIGTTTIAMQLYRRETGELMGEALAANEQSRYGSDVISRISFSNGGGLSELCQTISSQLSQMAVSCLEKAGLDAFDEVIITGNTTMLHLWEGLDPRGIAEAPFEPVSLFGCRSSRTLLGIEPFLPFCIGAYIGADTTCAVLSSGMLAHPESTALLLDLGTNGEIALYHEGKLLCASAAMGPAFEGAGLSFGMSALPGAVSGITAPTYESARVTVIPGAAAKGICGSGVLDALRTMLELGYIDETGLLRDAGAGFTMFKQKPAWRVPETDILITQQDIRQIQLAKSAICAGIETLLYEAEIGPGQIDRLYIAGGFGHYMDLSSAARIGLFPKSLRERAHALGNAALAGCVLLVLDSRAEQIARQIKDSACELQLSASPVFTERYMNNMFFHD